MGDADTTPWLALSYLLLSVIAWALVLWGLLSAWILSPFRARRDVLYLLRNGARKEGVILDSQRKGLRANGHYEQSVTFSLRNFSGTEIKESMELIDIRPEERRFDAGKKITLRVDERLKTRPVMVMDDSTPHLRPGILIGFFLGWLAIAAAIVWYYQFSYGLESNGRGWRFLAFYHPLLLCPVILLVTHWGIGKIANIFTGIPGNSLELKYYGYRTDAKVVSVSQTGTYINEQPEVRFELNYTDHLGQTHNASVKKIVPLINLAMAQAQSLPIFYLKDKPGQVAFADDLD